MKKKRLLKQDGFTLIELLIALSILTIMLVSFTALFTSSYLRIAEAEKKSQANYSTQQLIEDSVATEEAEDVYDLDITFANNETSSVTGGYAEKEDSEGLSSGTVFMPVEVVVVETDPNYHIEGLEQDIEVNVRTRNVVTGSMDFSLFFMNRDWVDPGNGYPEIIDDTIEQNEITRTLPNVPDTFDAGEYKVRFILDDDYYETNYDIYKPNFLAGGSGGEVIAAVNPRLWSAVSTSYSDAIYTVYSKSEKFITAGSSGSIQVAGRMDDWTEVSSGTMNALRDLDGNEDYVVAVGDDGTVIQSTDGGDNWGDDIAPDNHITTENLYGVLYSGPDRIIACGASGTIIVYNGEECNEDCDEDCAGDCDKWKVINNEQFNDKDLNGIVEGYHLTADQEIITIVGEDGLILELQNDEDVIISRDASNSNHDLKDVLYDGEKFIAVGKNGTILASSESETGENLLEWTNIENPTTENLNSIVFAFNTFIAVGDNSTVLVSSDGMAWNLVNIAENSWNINAIISR